MIEVVNDKERSLKNLKQIGTPRDDNKIYLENAAYEKMKEESYRDKRVFVLMGHTQRIDGRYATFIENVIPVREIEFMGNTPQWSNSTWSDVFREIKRLYEDMIIVGWAIDIRGMSPRVTPELERVHREHFGGVHQLLLLLDTLEQEESFYVYKENKIIEKDGFYIYHQAKKREKLEQIPIAVIPDKRKNRMPEVNVEVNLDEKEPWKGGRYRQLMKEEGKKKTSDTGNLGLAIAVAMLLFVIGVGVYENGGALFGGRDSIETNLLDEREGVNIDEGNNEPSTQTSVDDEEEMDVEIDVIPVEEETGTQT